MPKKPNNNAEITAKKRKEGKDLGGRPPFIIDYEKLEKLCAIFCTGEECASILGCSRETLNLRLKQDYAEAIVENPETEPEHKYDGFHSCFKKMSSGGKESLRREQFKMAVGERDAKGKITRQPNKGMLIWLGKNNLDQTDRSDLTTKNKPLPGAQAGNFDFTQLSEKDFLEFGDLLEKALTANETETKPSPDKMH